MLAILVVGLGHLYDRRWRLAIFYEFLIPILATLARLTILRNFAAGFVTLIGVALLQLFIIGQAVWFSLRRPRGSPMPRLAKWTWVAAAAMAVLSATAAGSGFLQDRVIGLSAYKMEDSISMAPTLEPGDRIVADRRAYARSTPKRGDVVVFVREGHGVWTKRIVAIGGDTLEFEDTGIVLDGKPLKEPYLAPPDPNVNSQRVFPGHTVASGDVFVLGDNRDNSNDSRYFGDISDKAVIGKVIGVYWSRDHSRIGTAVR